MHDGIANGYSLKQSCMIGGSIIQVDAIRTVNEVVFNDVPSIRLKLVPDANSMES